MSIPKSLKTPYECLNAIVSLCDAPHWTSERIMSIRDWATSAQMFIEGTKDKVTIHLDDVPIEVVQLLIEKGQVHLVFKDGKKELLQLRDLIKIEIK